MKTRQGKNPNAATSVVGAASIILPVTRDDPAVRTLPTIMKRVVMALGWSLGELVLREFGGRRFYVPNPKSNKRSELRRIIGDEGVKALADALADHLDEKRSVTLPKSDRVLRLRRNASIRAQHQHKSIADLSKQYRLTSRHITNILADEDAPDAPNYRQAQPPTPTLFD